MIQYFNRNTKKLETETVYGGSFVNWAYQTTLGKKLTDLFFSKRGLSMMMGAYENSKLSVSQIAPFVKAYEIPLGDFESRDYASFNEFFIRKFKPGLRNFTGGETTFSAGAEARYLAFENLKLTQVFQVKGIEINLGELLKNEELGRVLKAALYCSRVCVRWIITAFISRSVARFRSITVFPAPSIPSIQWCFNPNLESSSIMNAKSRYLKPNTRACCHD